MRFLAPLLLGVALLSSSCHGNDVADNNISAPIDSVFTSLFADDEPGAIVLVAKGDSILYERGFGLADLEKKKPIDSSTLFNICSISKQFSAIALLKLEEEGKLALSDSVAKYFPQFKAPFFKDITLRHLLSHTSGLPDARPRTESEWAEYAKNHETRFNNVRDYMLYAPTSESIRFYETLDTLNFEPGGGYEYQNPTFQLVYPMVEDLTGYEFDTWMTENIFEPAGMTHTFYFDPRKKMPASAHAYIPAEGPNVYKNKRPGNGRWEECDYGEANFFPTKADGGLYTSARDFHNYQCALFDGKLLGDSALMEATLPIVLTDIPNTYYGLGLFIDTTPGKGGKVFHTGDNGGFFTYAAYFPKNKVHYLIFANRCDWSREDAAEKIDAILHKHGLI